MKLLKKLAKKSTAAFLSLVMVMSMMIASISVVQAVEGTEITYTFTGDNKDTAGYAQGIITVATDTAGTYYLYWADDTKALDGFYPITTMTLTANGTGVFEFDYHTSIPAGATKIIATTNTSDLTVASAVSIYDVPSSKQLLTGAGGKLYSFSSYSDVHIDPDGYYKNYEKKWAQALEFSTHKGADFIVSSGDMVNFGTDSEWLIYEKILADSSFTGPVWESDGNHDLRSSITDGRKSFVKATGTDNTIANYDANKPYYSVKEQNTGDLFIFMALETHYRPHESDEFSAEQMAWLTKLLEDNYGTGINIYIIEHSPINGFGAGDRMDNPYYKAHLSEAYPSTVQFKSLLQKYPKLIWMSGHTHEDFEMGYNYSNENNTAANMIHNSAVVGSTWAEGTDTSLDYNNGNGRNSQGYHVEVYENEVVYYAANLTDELIYPAYCYIMEGSRHTTESETNATGPIVTVNTSASTGATGSTIAPGTLTSRYYFTNSLKWQTVGCYSWSDSDNTSCAWPGYGATYYGTNEQGEDLYYCDVPANHTKIIWNNGDNGYQTVDIELDGVNNFFTPSTTTSSKAVTVTADVWEYAEPTTNPTEPSESEVTPTTTETTVAPTVTEVTTTEETATTEPVTSEPTEETTIHIQPTTVPSQYNLGDVNRDESINIADVTLIQKSLVLLKVLDDEQLLLADTDGSGRVNIKDATEIQRLLAGIIDSIPRNSISVSQVGETTLATVLKTAKAELDAKYTFASYDQYQAVKKMYYQYKNEASASADVIADFEAKILALQEIAEYIGAPKVYQLRDTYYFVNTQNWSAVYGYAWTGSNYNVAWPGQKLEKCGTYNGYDVYGIKFSSAGEYANLIFNNNSAQTVDIDLTTMEYNAFSPTGSSSKYGVSNFDYTGATNEPTSPATDPVTEDTRYVLRYYNLDSHAWTDVDTYFTPQSDGAYVLKFTTYDGDSISCNVYDSTTKNYNCVSASTNFNYADGASYDYNLSGSTSRGKSITINSLSAGLVLTFTYNPTKNTLNITCG